MAKMRAVTALFLCAALFAALIDFATPKYIESVAANVDGAEFVRDAKSHAGVYKALAPRKQESFVPLVAFQCGYRNKFIDRDGKWRDASSGETAGCPDGKNDILKYCKRVYPSLDVTNIVEYSHESHIGAWCREDSANCKHHFSVRPYRCIVGEFVSESLQVPPRCRFSHINGHGKCNDYKFWSLKAESECGMKTEEETHQSMRLHSFSILDPCGLSMFRGVEFVCCPKSVEDKVEHVVDLEKDEKKDEKDDDEDEEEYDDEDDDEDDDDEEDEKAKKNEDGKSGAQDPYFKEDNNGGESEHERFRDAEERIEKKHRKMVTKVITEWSELFDRYNKMKTKDPKGAEDYKREMAARFRKTVAALEDENREQRTQVEELHDERVQSALNEKKRQATHDYRAALAKQVGSKSINKNKYNVLKTLKNYIRTEERDRTHMLNRYRHLLRADPEAAVSFEPILLHRLRYIDLRVNGTLAMLHDFPRLERQVRPIALEFWESYRRENTPEEAVASEAARSNGGSLLAGGEDANERLVGMYKHAYQRAHPEVEEALRNAAASSKADDKVAIDRTQMKKEEEQRKTVAATATKMHNSAPRPSAVRQTAPQATKSASSTLRAPTTSETLAEDSDEDQFDDDNEEERLQDDILNAGDEQKLQKPAKFDKKVEKAQKQIVKPVKTAPEDEKLKKKKEEGRNDEKNVSDESDDEDDDEDDEDDSDEDDAENKSNNNNEKKPTEEDDLSIAIEPIHGSLIRDEPAYSRRHDALVAYNMEYSDASSGALGSLAQIANRTNVALGMLICALVVLVAGVLVKRRSARHPGFVEVDVCTPEERHVAGLQVNGYENPTYAHFGAKA